MQLPPLGQEQLSIFEKEDKRNIPGEPKSCLIVDNTCTPITAFFPG